MKAFMKEFREFISKGNVMSMAIGIIIGSAFTAIITSLNEDILTPILGLILGKVDFSNLSITVGSASIMYGKFIQSVITFLITALTLFIILKCFNSFTAKMEKRKVEEKKEEAPAPVPEDIKLLSEIRDLLENKK